MEHTNTTSNLPIIRAAFPIHSIPHSLIMEHPHCLPWIHPLLLLTMLFIATPITVRAQISNMPCTISMITTFTPCLNFITGSSANGNSTTQLDCCKSLNTLINTSLKCTCLLILSANNLFSVPSNRTTTILLPQVCNTGGISTQCKGLSIN